MPRLLKLLSAVAIGVCLLGAAQAEVVNLTPKEAYARVQAGDLLLIDVRTPREWEATGVADGAARVTLQAPDFQAQVEALHSASPDKDIAFICRTGRRSLAAAKMLDNDVPGPVYNVLEGMAGSRLERGWIADGLPYSKDEACIELACAQ